MKYEREVQEKRLPGELGVAMSYELPAISSWLIVSTSGGRGLKAAIETIAKST